MNTELMFSSKTDLWETPQERKDHGYKWTLAGERKEGDD